MKKFSVFAGLGGFYKENSTGFSNLRFTLKNITDLSVQLKTLAWDVTPAMFDATASQQNIFRQLTDIINNNSGEDDWLLFYFTGHASRKWVLKNEQLNAVHYCVTYHPRLRYDYLPDVSEFFSEIDYDQIVNLFREKKPNGHLITILDCCYAFGIIENFFKQQDFHTIIAASSENAQAAYTSNSLFFTAFRQCWNLPFSQMSTKLKSLMQSMNAPNIAKTQIAKNFSTQSLNI